MCIRDRYTWTLGLERKLGNLTGDLGYVGTAAVRLPRISYPNAFSGAVKGFAPYTTFDNAGNVTGGFGVENIISAGAHSTYCLLYTSDRHRAQGRAVVRRRRCERPGRILPRSARSRVPAAALGRRAAYDSVIEVTDPLVGETVDTRYELRRLIARGGMGPVSYTHLSRVCTPSIERAPWCPVSRRVSLRPTVRRCA